MNVAQAFAIGATRSGLTLDQKRAASAALMADHEAILPAASYEDFIKNAPKEERRRIYKMLEEEIPKYPAVTAYHDDIFGKPFLALRAKMEAFRNLRRDKLGKIILSDDEVRARIEHFRAQITETLGPDADLSEAHGPWVENLKNEIAICEKRLSGEIKTDGSIWDFIREGA
jgi:hypothetical protein